MRSVALVIEDNPADQALARSLLEAADWEVYSAATAALSMGLINSWLGGHRELRHVRILILFDLIMDLHGLHLAAIVRDQQRRGLLKPAALVALTAGYSDENKHFVRLAGCDAILRKPLTAARVEQLAQIEPKLQPEQLPEEDEWLRKWLVEEGQRMLSLKVAGLHKRGYAWTAEEAATLLKLLSGKGHQPADSTTAPLIDRFGGYEHARTRFAGLVPLLAHPYDSLLSELLAGLSIVECGQRLGYGRSQSYVLFRRLSERVSQLLRDERATVDGKHDLSLLDTAPF